MEYKCGMKVEATANGARGVIVAVTEQGISVAYAGIGERFVPMDKAVVWLRPILSVAKPKKVTDAITLQARADKAAAQLKEKAERAAKRLLQSRFGKEYLKTYPVYASLPQPWLDRVQTLGLLIAQVPDQHEVKFLRDYLAATKTMLDSETGISRGDYESSWSYSLRVEWPNEPAISAPVGFTVTPMEGNRLAICCNGLVWELIEAGFRFGSQRQLLATAPAPAVVSIGSEIGA